MFNNLTHNGEPYSRYISSWKIAGGYIYRGGLFEDWLREEQKLTEEEIRGILNLAEIGKLELQENAKRFIKKNIKQHLIEKEMDETAGFEECNGGHFNWLSKDYFDFCAKGLYKRYPVEKVIELKETLEIIAEKKSI